MKLQDLLEARKIASSNVAQYLTMTSGFWEILERYLLSREQTILLYPFQWTLKIVSIQDAILASDSHEHIVLTVELTFDTGPSSHIKTDVETSLITIEHWIYPLAWEPNFNPETMFGDWLACQTPKRVKHWSER